MPGFIDHDALDRRLTEGCEQYEKTAPTVYDYLNILYMRLREQPHTVVLPEVMYVERLVEEGQWANPHLAANQLVHLFERIGRSTAGMIDH